MREIDLRQEFALRAKPLHKLPLVERERGPVDFRHLLHRPPWCRHAAVVKAAERQCTLVAPAQASIPRVDDVVSLNGPAAAEVWTQHLARDARLLMHPVEPRLVGFRRQMPPPRMNQNTSRMTSSRPKPPE
jgi:hypothetical protein